MEPNELIQLSAASILAGMWSSTGLPKEGELPTDIRNAVRAAKLLWREVSEEKA